MRRSWLAFAGLLIMACAAAPAPGIRTDFLVGACPGAAPAADTSGVLTLRMPLKFDLNPTHTKNFGHVVARLTVDTLGRAEAGSIVILESNNPLLSATICEDLAEQQYEPTRIDGRLRRARGNADIRFIMPTGSR